MQVSNINAIMRQTCWAAAVFCWTLSCSFPIKMLKNMTCLKYLWWTLPIFTCAVWKRNFISPQSLNKTALDFSHPFCLSLKLTSAWPSQSTYCSLSHSNNFYLNDRRHMKWYFYMYFFKAWQNIHNAHAANTKTPHLCPETHAHIRAW